eukprot:PhM_4_TR17656/c0_g2_i1/m.95290
MLFHPHNNSNSNADQSDKVLRGRYKRLVAPDMHATVEHHYNHGMTSMQRRTFKAVVKSIFERMQKTAPGANNDIPDSKVVEGHAIFRAHAEGVIAADHQYHVVAWLATASPYQQNCFRDVFSKFRGLPLFNGRSETKVAYAAEKVVATAELVRRREIEHVLRAQRATDMLGMWTQPSPGGTPPVEPAAQPPPPRVTVVQRAHSPSQRGAPWGTLYRHEDMAHQLWVTTHQRESERGVYDTHGKAIQNFNDNYSLLELDRYRRQLKQQKVDGGGEGGASQSIACGTPAMTLQRRPLSAAAAAAYGFHAQPAVTRLRRPSSCASVPRTSGYRGVAPQQVGATSTTRTAMTTPSRPASAGPKTKY